MSREAHVRFWEGVGVQLLCATQLFHRRRAPPPAGAGRVRRLLQCVASPSGARPACAVRISSDGPIQPDGPDHRAAGARGPASSVSPCRLMVGWSCCALQVANAFMASLRDRREEPARLDGPARRLGLARRGTRPPAVVGQRGLPPASPPSFPVTLGRTKVRGSPALPASPVPQTARTGRRASVLG
jgi:hypothetical protein